MDDEKSIAIREALYAKAREAAADERRLCLVFIQHEGKHYGGLFLFGALYFKTGEHETNQGAVNSVMNFGKSLPEEEEQAIVAEQVATMATPEPASTLLTAAGIRDDWKARETLKVWMAALIDDGYTLIDVLEAVAEMAEEVARELDTDGRLEDVHLLVV